jgi:Fur family transcriptional regulator, ferric uptake regulator
MQATGKIDPAPAPGWAEGALRELTRRGYRAGGARTAVIELLAEQGGCMEAEDVAAKLRQRGQRIGTASVYRALGVLSEVGLLHKVAVAGSPVRFELVLPGGEHHHHIVCDRCGRTVAFSDERLESAVHAISERTSFDVQAHDVTLHGTCEACQE